MLTIQANTNAIVIGVSVIIVFFGLKRLISLFREWQKLMRTTYKLIALTGMHDLDQGDKIDVTRQIASWHVHEDLYGKHVTLVYDHPLTELNAELTKLTKKGFLIEEYLDNDPQLGHIKRVHLVRLTPNPVHADQPTQPSAA